MSYVSDDWELGLSLVFACQVFGTLFFRNSQKNRAVAYRPNTYARI